MIDIVVDQKSVDNTLEHLEVVRKRIFEQVRLGMAEAMQGLGATEIAFMGGAGIQSHTGKLAHGFEEYSVRDTSNLIIGTIMPRREMKLAGRTFKGFIATALDEGFRVGVIKSKLAPFASKSSMAWGSASGDWHVAPHPWMAAAVTEFEPTLIDIIQERITLAVEEA